MRELTSDELALISGGYGWDNEDIVVTGSPYPPPSFPYFPSSGPSFPPPPPSYPSYPGSGGPSTPPTTPPPPVPDCHNSNDVENVAAPDGADYLVPEQIDGNYLVASFNHIAGMRETSGKYEIAQEIGRMYTNASHPNFVDFKRAGTDSGPAGWTDAGNVSYYSESMGQTVSADAFEAFGNFWYGFLMTAGGFSPEETRVIAAVVQGNGYQQLTSWQPSEMVTAFANAAMYGDDPKDRPFVNNGVFEAQQYLANPQVYDPMKINTGDCG